MKKLLALALVALMVVPFGIFTSAATVPAEPTATGTAVVYTAYDYDENKAYPKSATTNDGSSLEKLYSTSAFSSWQGLFNTDNAALGASGKLMDGGYFVIVGKALAGLGSNWNYQGVIPATTKPLVITGKDPANGTSYVSTKDGAIYYMNESGANAGQFGMFMMDAGTTELSNTLVFEGDVIFKDTVILNRSNTATAEAGKLAPTISAKSKIVIDSTVQFASMTGGQKYVLNVDEGAYAYLHALGFGQYTGTGTIVVGDEIKASVNEDIFAGFDGEIVDKDGKALFTEEDPGQTPSNPGTTPENPGTTPDAPSNPSTGDMTFVVVAIALASVAGAVLTLKKRAQR